MNYVDDLVDKLKEYTNIIEQRIIDNIDFILRFIEDGRRKNEDILKNFESEEIIERRKKLRELFSTLEEIDYYVDFLKKVKGNPNEEPNSPYIIDMKEFFRGLGLSGFDR